MTVQRVRSICIATHVPAAALERLDVVAAPAQSQVAPLEAVLSALRNTVQALEASQASAFGAQVDLPPTTSMPHCLSYMRTAAWQAYVVITKTGCGTSSSGGSILQGHANQA